MLFPPMDTPQLLSVLMVPASPSDWFLVDHCNAREWTGSHGRGQPCRAAGTIRINSSVRRLQRIGGMVLISQNYRVPPPALMRLSSITSTRNSWYVPWEAEKQLDYGSEAFWLAVRGNLEKLSDQKSGMRSSAVDSGVAAEDRSDAAKSLLPEPWELHHLEKLDRCLETTSAKANSFSCRYVWAFTGRDDGPELAALLLMGRRNCASA